MKRMISLLLALVLVIGMLPLTTLAASLAITQEPKSVKVLEGQTAKVTLKATGEGLTYKWYYKNPGATKYSYTSSFKGNSYSITMNEERDGRYVYCKVYDKNGNYVKSKTVSLRMAEPAAIVQEPKSVKVANGETASVSLKATGDGLTYKWYYKNPGATKYSYTSAFTGPDYSIKMNKDRDGRYVYCKVYDKYGTVVKSKTVSLRMTDGVTIKSQSKSFEEVDTNYCDLYVSFNGGTAPYSVTWQKTNAAGTYETLRTYTVKEADVDGDYSSWHTVKILKADEGRKFRAVIKDAKGNSVNSTAITVNKVHPTLSITQQPTDQYVAIGDTATFTVKAEGADLSYRWYYRDPGATSNTRVAGLNADTYSFTMTEKTVGRQVFVKVIENWNLEEKYFELEKTSNKVYAYSNEMKITKQPQDWFGYEYDFADFSVEVAGGKAPYTYKWEYSVNGGAYVTDKTSTSETLVLEEVEESVLEEGRKYRCVITDANGKSIISDTALLGEVLHFDVPIDEVPYSAKVGETVEFWADADGGVKPYTYTWQCTSLGGNVFNNIADRSDVLSRVSGLGTDTLELTVAEVDGKHNYVYRCVVTDARGETITTPAVGVEVLAEPLSIKTQPVNATVSTEGVSVILHTAATGGKGPYSYQWQGRKVNSTTYYDLDLANGTDSIAALVLTSSYSEDVNKVRYRCVITDANGDTVTTKEASYILPLDFVDQPYFNRTSYAEGDTAYVFVFLRGGVGPYTYQWQWMPGFNTSYGWADCANSNHSFYSFTVDAMHASYPYYYRCIITDAQGNTVTSDPVRLN